MTNSKLTFLLMTCKDSPFITLALNNLFDQITFSFYRVLAVLLEYSFDKGNTFKQHLTNALDQISNTESGSGGTFVHFNYPKQFLKHADTYQLIWKSKADRNSISIFTITGMEVFRRRNKRKDSCLVDWRHLDDLVLDKHFQTVSCRAPYQRSDKPLCNTSREIMETMYEVTKVRDLYYPPPCEGMSNMKFKFNFLPKNSDPFFINKSYPLSITYPKKTRVITQTQSVDAHTLIGNVGGYVGLFLGMLYFEQSSLYIFAF